VRRTRELGHWLDMHRDEVLDLLLVRGALDGLAAGEAAARRDPDDLGRVRAARAAFEAAVEEGAGSDRLMALDVDFHIALAQAGGSPLLTGLLVDLHEHLADSRHIGFAPPERPQEALREHAAIVASIEAGDGERARRAVAAHLARVREVLDRALAER